MTPDLYAQWTRVAVCEEGGWVGSSGLVYPDSLGISAANWYGNGGGSDVSPDAEILVAIRVVDGLVGQVIQGQVVYVGFVPDQGGCAGGW